MAIPKYDELFNPLLESVRILGGSASVAEIEEKVAEILKLSDEEVSEIHKGNRTVLGYRLAWARNYLKRYGLLDNSERGIWSFTTKGYGVSSVKKEEVNKTVKSLDKKTSIEEEVAEGAEPESSGELWQDVLLQELLKLTPEAFERLCQRLLRESGFVQVEVTGRTGDGGIDGRGIVKMSGLLSFHIVFQCKRYSGSVSSQQIRDFRGAMIGRSDKGLLITTGTFTRDAKKEASRDGAPPVDLIDGEDLVEKLKELRLGVNVKNQEFIEIDKDWLKNF